MKSEEFIREVDEELRRDRFAMLWRRYGAFVLSVAVLIVVGTAAKVGWDQWRQRERAAEALRFAGAERALAAGQGAEAAQQFAALAAEGGTGFAALARLKEAEAKLGQKDEAGALTALDQLATTTGDDPILRDLATLLAVERRPRQGRPGRAHEDPRAAGSRRFALAAPSPRAAGADGDPRRRSGQGPQPAGRSQPRGRGGPVAAAPRGGTAAGDRRKRRSGQLVSAAPRRTVLTGAVAGLLAGCSEGTWWGENSAPPLPGERKSVLLIEDELRADPRLAELNIALPPPVRNAAWPQSGGSATHAMEHLEAAESITVAWRTDVGAGSGSRSRIIAGPVVADGRVFAVDADGMATAVDATNGRVLWQFAAENVERVDRLGGGAAAVADGRVYLANGNGMVFAVDAATGAEIWRRQLKAPCAAHRPRSPAAC